MAKRLRPQVREVPWGEFRKRAGTVFLMLQAGWMALSEAERTEARRLVMKSRGKPKNLSRQEAQRLGRIAAKAATASGRARSGRGTA
jgi:hypothetical protein